MPSSPAQLRDQTAAEPAGMDVIFERHVQRVYQFLYARVGNREDAEDLTSEVFLKASDRLDINRPEASISTWLFTVARTVLADHWRRYYRYGAIAPLDDHQVMAAPPQAEPDDGDDETVQLVREVLAALPERYSKVLELRFLRGLTIRETAEEMGVTPDNAKVIQHRALAHAAARFNKLDGEDDAMDRAAEPATVRP